MVHRRSIDGEEVVFGVQGALLGNAMTFWDHDTGSVWSQPSGEAVAGPRLGQRLETLPISYTTWDAWRDLHPGTLALDQDLDRSEQHPKHAPQPLFPRNRCNSATVGAGSASCGRCR